MGYAYFNQKSSTKKHWPRDRISASRLGPFLFNSEASAKKVALTSSNLFYQTQTIIKPQNLLLSDFLSQNLQCFSVLRIGLRTNLIAVFHQVILLVFR